MVRLLLASRGIPGLASLVGANARHAVLIPDAADPLGEPQIPAEVECELRGAGLEVARVTLGASTAEQLRAAVTAADVVAVSGGDPFHLLAVARAVAFGGAVSGALEAGALYIGGAMLVGPTLAPLTLTSPFTAPPELELSGLGLVDVLVLPHDDHAGRHERHLAAQAAFGDQLRLIMLRDGDVLLHDGGRESILRR